MTKIWKEIFNNRLAWLYLLLLLMVAYGAINYLKSVLLQTDELLANSLSTKLSQKQVEYIVKNSHQKATFTSALSSLYIPISTLIISGVIIIGVFFMSFKIKFLDILKIVLVGEVVMLLQEGMKFLWFYFIKRPNSLIELKNFAPLSFQNFFSFNTLKSWQVTMLSISLFDLLFMLVLAKGFQYRMKDTSLEKSFLFVTLTYGVALFLYIAIKIVALS